MKHVLNFLKIINRFFFKIKKKVWTKFVKLSVGSHEGYIWANRYTKLTKNTHLKKYVNFNGLTVHGLGKVYIDSYFHSGVECLLITSFHDYDNGNGIPYDSHKSINKEIVIEECVWLGSRVIILGGVTIGEGAIIQAGAVVVKDIPKYAIAGGSPAKVFKYRNKERYLSLKKEGKYLDIISSSNQNIKEE